MSDFGQPEWRRHLDKVVLRQKLDMNLVNRLQLSGQKLELSVNGQGEDVEDGCLTDAVADKLEHFKVEGPGIMSTCSQPGFQCSCSAG